MGGKAVLRAEGQPLSLAESYKDIAKQSNKYQGKGFNQLDE